ncbi:MAG: phosphodiesterase [Clostridia bacterium]|nr:phosphodiesterase [Clostridia bacterium]
MKLLIASDIHGDLESANNVISRFAEEGCDRLLLLGDILYHGPRNDLPEHYNPKSVISLLNKYRNIILAVRGNCDTEVDQMVLNFPVLSDYGCLFLDGLTVYATHGHKYSIDSPPPLCKGDILLGGHTHVPACIGFGDENYYLNPGSVAIPKNGFQKSYMIYENKCFTVKDFNGNTLLTKQF